MDPLNFWEKADARNSESQSTTGGFPATVQYSFRTPYVEQIDMNKALYI